MGKIDWIETENPEVRFENNAIGRIKKEVWDADEAHGRPCRIDAKR